MSYLLDADVMIRAKRDHYGFEFCPAFWDWLVRANKQELVFSIEMVEDDLTAGNDQLATWAAARGASFFLRPDARTLPALATVSTWVTGQGYAPAAVTEFLQASDYYLIAQALAGGHTLVTHEVSEPMKKKRIKIPDVCIAVAVKCIRPSVMLRAEKPQFVLAP